MQSNNPIPDYVKFGPKSQMMNVAMRNDIHGNIGIGEGNISIPPKQPEEVPPSNAYLRAQFLDEVEKLVCKDRNVTHGDAEDNFRVIADLWNVYLKNSKSSDNTDDLNNKDVAIMMCLFKISRLMTNVNNMENWLDLAGYAACGGGIVKKL